MMISKSVRLQLCAIFLPALAIALLGVVSCQTGRLSSGVSLHLAKDGATGYAIVKPEKPAEVDDYAVSALTNFLFQKTGAVFPVVLPGQVSPANKHIFVGLSEPALKIAGKDPLAALKDQEYVARSKVRTSSCMAKECTETSTPWWISWRTRWGAAGIPGA